VRSVHFDPASWEDSLYWLASDRKTARRLVRLIAEIQRDPCVGIGKPEPLQGELSGYWSRRINDEHRLVYRASDTEVKVLMALVPLLTVPAAPQTRLGPFGLPVTWHAKMAAARISRGAVAQSVRAADS
jgi:toxin YoeB